MLDMLMLTRWMTGMATLLLAGALAAPATAGVAYKWTDASGNVSFTDDADRIPKQFRSDAKKIETGPLADYEHLSPARVASEERIAALEARTERLREMAKEADLERLGASVVAAGGQPALGAGTSSFTSTVDVGGSTIRIPATNPLDGPIVVEQVRSVRKGKNVTQTATVVRQGDEILMIVYPEPHRQINSNDFVREDDLLRRD